MAHDPPWLPGAFRRWPDDLGSEHPGILLITLHANSTRSPGLEIWLKCQGHCQHAQRPLLNAYDKLAPTAEVHTHIQDSRRILRSKSSKP